MYEVERTYKQERPYNSTSSAARVATTWELCYRDDSMRRARATPRTTALRHAAPRTHDRGTPRQPALRLAMRAALLFVPRHSVLFLATLRRATLGCGGGNATVAAEGTTVHIVA